MRMKHIFLTFIAVAINVSISVNAQPNSLQQLQSEHVDLRFGMFIHFNINTYHHGWGNDRVDPKIFNPVALDCDQWAKAAKSAGIKYALLTTKHHDGFALWPSKQIPPNGKEPYTIAQSSVPDKDVVKEYVDAFRKEGIQPGFYFSMWDVANGVGGPYNKSDSIDWPKVKPYILGQITELLGGKYGEIPIFVIDGYMWKMGHKQIPIQEIRGLIKSLQPNCLLVDHNGGTPWNVDIVYFEEPLKIVAPDGNTIAACQGQTISKDWFWDNTSADSTKLKSVKDIVNHLNRLEPLYTNFIINCPPNRSGVFDTAIVNRLAQIGKAWKPNLSRASLPQQAPIMEYPITPVSASATSGNALLAIDGLNDGPRGPRYQTLWESDSIMPQAITLDFGLIYNNVDMLMYLPRREPGNTKGNITSYKIYVSTDGTSYKQVADGKWASDPTIKRAQFAPQTARYLRFEALEANGGVAVIGELTVGSNKIKITTDTQKTAHDDWQLMLNKLNLKVPDNLPDQAQDPKRPQNTFQKAGSKNWTDSSGNTYTRSVWGNWSNYDEENAGKYKQIDPLTLKNGQKVTRVDKWWSLRRPEILNDYCTEIYGTIPENTPKVTFTVESIDSSFMNGKVIKKLIVGHIDNSSYPAASPSVSFELYLPAKAKYPVPLIVRISSRYEVFPTPQGSMPSGIEKVIEAGWAYANFNSVGVQMDNGLGLSEGIIGLVYKGRPRSPKDWGAIAAWSWGLSRTFDYFETDKTIDIKKVGIQGHSRCGKTALLAAALDTRWAIIFASCSGSMGASLEMRSWGENIDNVAGSGEYYWMAGNFLKYAGNWTSMPVDAHELIALLAPRPVFITGGTQDQWADPKGEFLSCLGAEPVYNLLGKKGLGTSVMPAPDVSLIDGEIAFRYHEGGHNDALDWPVFIEFAKKQFSN